MWLLSFMPCQMVASLDSFSCCFLVGFVSSIFLLPFLPFFPFFIVSLSFLVSMFFLLHCGLFVPPYFPYFCSSPSFSHSSSYVLICFQASRLRPQRVSLQGHPDAVRGQHLSRGGPGRNSRPFQGVWGDPRDRHQEARLRPRPVCRYSLRGASHQSGRRRGKTSLFNPCYF